MEIVINIQKISRRDPLISLCCKEQPLKISNLILLLESVAPTEFTFVYTGSVENDCYTRKTKRRAYTTYQHPDDTVLFR